MKVELKKNEPKTLEERIRDELECYARDRRTPRLIPAKAATIAAFVASSPIPVQDPYPVTLTVTLESKEEALVLRAACDLVPGDYLADKIKASHFRDDYNGVSSTGAFWSTAPLYDALFGLTHG
jgi:hypothetical protein